MTNQLRYITRAILAAILMLSCSENIIPEEQEYAISMTASSADMNTSRALITNNGELQSTKLGVGVYAYKAVNSNKTMVFNNTELTYNTATKVWDYSPTRYWDKAATVYRFLAYSPYSTSNISYNTNNHTLTISDIPYWQVIDNEVVDYLVAKSSGSAESYLNNPTSTAVPLSFSHILSQLVINIKKDANLSQTYLLKQVEYLNVPQGGDAKATYTLPQEGTATMSEITLLNADATLTQFKKDEGETVRTGNISLPHLVVPFTLTNDKEVQVKVTYTVAGTERNKTVDTGITQLEAGKRYELTLTFKGADVSFGMVVKKWEDVDVDEDPKYNW